MPVGTSARTQLLAFLDERVFEPVANADPNIYANAENRKLLKSVRKRVRETKARYIAEYPDAAAVRRNFTQDLNSKPGQALAVDIWMLNQDTGAGVNQLERFEDIQPAFIALCSRLGA